MKREIHSGWEWHKPFAYSQAIRFGDLLFVSGQAALGGDGSIVGGNDFQAQARQAFKNLATVLEAASVIGYCSMRIAGGISGRRRSMRRSSVNRNIVLL